LLNKLLVGGVVSVALVAPWLITTKSGTSRAESPTAEIKTATRGPIVGTVPMVDYEEQYAVEEEQRQVTAYLAAVKAEEDRQVAEYLAAVEAERLRQEQEAARLHPPVQRAPAPISRGGTTVGECTGFAIPDYIIQRESGGNPNAMNPSGAYGCAQTLLSHYNSGGSCAGLDPYSIDGQRECVWRLSNGGTNLNPWAQTR